MFDDWMKSRESDHGSLAALVVIVIIILTLLVGIGLSRQPAAPRVANIDVPQLESDLSNSPRFIAFKLERIVNHVEVNGSNITVVVGSGFGRLDFEDQASAMRTIGEIAGPSRGGDSFDIYDLATRKQIATWDSSTGLQLRSR